MLYCVIQKQACRAFAIRVSVVMKRVTVVWRYYSVVVLPVRVHDLSVKLL